MFQGKHLVFENNALHNLIDNIGETGFFTQAATEISKVFPHQYCLVLLHSNGNKPTLLFECLRERGYEQGLDLFLNRTHRINPYVASRCKSEYSGFLSMKSLSGDGLCEKTIECLQDDIILDDTEELGYVTRGWPRKTKESGIFVPVDCQHTIQFSLSSQTGDIERSLLPPWDQESMGLFIGIVKKHYQITQNEIDAQTSESVDEEFIARGLTERETEIVKLILSGCSSLAISLRLNIALPTVKSHRRNIYRKLSISSLNELFAIFNTYLK